MGLVWTEGFCNTHFCDLEWSLLFEQGKFLINLGLGLDLGLVLGLGLGLGLSLSLGLTLSLGLSPFFRVRKLAGIG